MWLIVAALGTVSVLLLARLYSVLPGNRLSACSGAESTGPCRTMIVLGSGGHTAEMLKLLGTISFADYSPRCYVMSSSDVHSPIKAQAVEQQQQQQQRGSIATTSSYSMVQIPRSRDVGQSFVTSIFTTLYSLFFGVRSVFQFQPDLLLLNGPGTCVPVCWSVVLMNFCCRWRSRRCRVVFIESVCRVHSLSLSARMLAPFLDRLFVQWPSVPSKNAEYHGRLV